MNINTYQLSVVPHERQYPLWYKGVPISLDKIVWDLNRLSLFLKMNKVSKF